MQQKPLILIVEDSPTNMRILVNSVQEDYQVIVARTGVKALEAVLTRQPDLILLDILLPDTDGITVCKSLKHNACTCFIPVIFISNMQDMAHKTEALAAGGVDYITKPFHKAELNARIKAHIELKKNRELLEQQKEAVSSELAENRRQLQTLMDNLPGIAYRSDTTDKRTMQFMSVGTFELTGYQPSYFMDKPGKGLISIVVPDDRKGLLAALGKTLQENRPFEYVYRIISKSGAYKWVREQAVPILDAQGQPYALEGFISDVTESRKLELNMREENRLLKRKIKTHYLGNIVGNSSPMQRLYKNILKAASSDGNVIIYGESGSGKELVAKAIHEQSTRFDKPYIPVNCGAITDSLFESEFFGHKKGAFTGAIDNRQGFFEQAGTGTLFLDELGEVSLPGQIKLLRAIEGGGFIPVGGKNLLYAKPRIIAATNKNLAEMLKNGEMREDFFYRIHVVPVYVPPLREHKEDIPLLVNHFLRLFPEHKDRPPITAHLLNALLGYDWPGNVRELQNVLFQYLHMGELALGTTHQEYAGPAQAAAQNKPLAEALAEFEAQHIREVLQANRWQRIRTAEALQVDRRTLFRKMQQYNIQKV